MRNLLKSISQINADSRVAYLSSRFMLIVLGSSQLSTKRNGATPHSFLQHSGVHSCSTALDAAGGHPGLCVWAQCRTGSPSSPISSQQEPAQLSMEPEIWSFPEVCSTHGSKHSTSSLLFGKTNLGDKCARWTGFAWRNLRSTSLCWCHKQLKAEPSKKITHINRSIIFFFLSTSSVIIPLYFPFLQQKLLWHLLFYSHQVRYLTCFLHKGQLWGKSEKDIVFGTEMWAKSLCRWFYSYSWKWKTTWISQIFCLVEVKKPQRKPTCLPRLTEKSWNSDMTLIWAYQLLNPGLCKE